MTLKCQVTDPNMSGFHYLEHGWRYKHSINEAPIGNGTAGNGYVSNDVNDVIGHRSRSWSRYIWMPICWRLLKIALDRLCVLFNIAMFLQYLHFHQHPFSPFLLPWGQIFVQPWSTATAALAGMFHSWTLSRCWSIVWLTACLTDAVIRGCWCRRSLREQAGFCALRWGWTWRMRVRAFQSTSPRKKSTSTWRGSVPSTPTTRDSLPLPTFVVISRYSVWIEMKWLLVLWQYPLSQSQFGFVLCIAKTRFQFAMIFFVLSTTTVC